MLGSIHTCLGSAHRAHMLLPDLLCESRQETGLSVIWVLILENDPATREVILLLLASEEGFRSLRLRRKEWVRPSEHKETYYDYEK